MVEAGGGASFGEIGFGMFGPKNRPRVRHIDGDKTLQLLIMGEIHKAGATFAQHSLDPVATNTLWCCRGSLIYECWQIRVCVVEVVHGRLRFSITP
jgi:hypothetical protein